MKSNEEKITDYVSDNPIINFNFDASCTEWPNCYISNDCSNNKIIEDIFSISVRKINTIR